MHRQQESIYTAVLWLGKLNSCLEKVYGGWLGQKRWRAKSKKEPGTEGTSLILMVSIQMHFCRILAAACGSTPARASGTLFEAWQSEITYSICIRSNYTPEPFYRFTFTMYFFFATITMQHTMIYLLIQKDIDLQIFFECKKFRTHRAMCI